MFKAKIVEANEGGHGFWPSEKEQTGHYAAIVIHKGELIEPIKVRCWMGRSRNASTVHASVWINSRAVHTSGSGKAGGYGYHKESEAVFRAFQNAGVEFRNDDGEWVSFGGHGDGPMREAIISTVRALGYRGKVMVVGS